MFISLLAAALAAAAPSGPQALPEWMAGSWTTTTAADEWTEEWWTPPRAGIMLGASRSGKSEALGFFEHMRIIRQGDGLAFCAMPQGKSSTCFKAVAADATSVTFENPTHDFPKRIAYRLDGEQLIGEISGLKGERVQRWRYRRLGN